MSSFRFYLSLDTRELLSSVQFIEVNLRKQLEQEMRREIQRKESGIRRKGESFLTSRKQQTLHCSAINTKVSNYNFSQKGKPRDDETVNRQQSFKIYMRTFTFT